MAAAVSFSPTQPKHRQTVTINGTGFSLSTAYTVSVAQQSIGTQTFPVTSDGSGAFSVTFVANGTGKINVTVNTTPGSTSQAASGTVQVCGD